MNALYFFIFFVMIALQIYFSISSKKLGLILPVISFLFSIGVCIWFALYGPIINVYTITMDDGRSYNFETIEEANKFISSNKDKKVVEFSNVNDEKLLSVPGEYFSSVSRLFFGTNIITLILLAIYFGFKKLRRKHVEHINV